MFKMFTSESRDTVFPYHYFPEIIIPRYSKVFFNFSPFVLGLAFRYENKV